MTIYNKEHEKEVLIICLEFVQPLFSGNGILCQSLVRGLLHANRVTVLCARPSDHADEPILIESSNTPGERLDDHPNLTVVVVDVPPSTWRKLDRNSCYEYLAASAVEQMKKNRPKHYDYVFAIDWSAIPTVDILKQNQIILSSPLTSSTNIASSVFIFLVFRVFSSSKELCSSEDDYMFYVNRELDAVNKADITFVLSHVDQIKLSKIQREQLKLAHDKEMNKITKMKELHVHVPPLRNDFYHQCQKLTVSCNVPSPSSKIQKKKYVLCNVRLSPEKNALLFAKIMVKIEKTLLDLDLVPMMVGSVCDDVYAKQVYSTLPSQTVIVNKFLSSEELISILDQTVLMIHPPLYDAFGMTISEAAASGVPSLIHHKNIGASSLFRVEEGEILHGDMSSSSIHDCVKSYLESSEKLMEVSEKAKVRALSWNVNAYAEGLESTIKKKHLV